MVKSKSVSKAMVAKLFQNVRKKTLHRKCKKKWVRKRAKLVFFIDTSCNSLLNSKADFINKHVISFGILEDDKQ